MASLIAAQLSSGAHNLCCDGVDHQGAASTKPHLTFLQFRKRELEGKSQLQTSSQDASRNPGFLHRREMISNAVMVSGAALLSLGAAADAAHAAAGEIETAEEAATNPLIQKLLERSRINKPAYDAARLEDYYRRNFKEYFEFVEGSCGTIKS